jgi:hypothetical protein
LGLGWCFFRLPPAEEQGQERVFRGRGTNWTATKSRAEMAAGGGTGEGIVQPEVI